LPQEPQAAAEGSASPALLSPLPGSKLDFANPVIFWAPVEGAVSYVVEICRDEPCSALLDRAVLDASQLGNEPQWRPKPLAVGTLYWRVTARDRSGGNHPSGVGRLEILSDKLDHEPPIAKLALSGPQARVAGRLFTAPAPGFEVSAQDAGCGLYIATPAVEGSLESPGEHKVGGYAIDRCGNRVDLPPILFTIDAEAPTVRAEVVEDSALAKTSQPKAAHGSGRRVAAPGETGLYESVDGRKWLPLWRPGQAADPSAKPEAASDEISGDRPRLYLAARGVKLTIDGKTIELGAGKLLALSAEDAGAGVATLRFHVTPASPGASAPPTLRIEATDRVGNNREVSWPLALS
jgi:hypothetical protein